MACEHRYRVINVDGKGSIECRRCGDVRQDQIPLEADMEAIRDRMQWERKRSPIWLPGDI